MEVYAKRNIEGVLFKGFSSIVVVVYVVNLAIFVRENMGTGMECGFEGVQSL